MTEVNKEKLRSAAEAAPKGEWKFDSAVPERHFCAQVWDSEGKDLAVLAATESGSYAAQHIAAANPRAVLSLLDENAAQAARIAKLEKQTACTMGVGSGDGRLFVHGDHESIKAAQAIVIERDDFAACIAELERECERLRKEVDKRIKQGQDSHEMLNGVLRQNAELRGELSVLRSSEAHELGKVRAELEDFRKDAERWRYFRDRLGGPIDGDLFSAFNEWLWGEGPTEDVEAAIDASMQEASSDASS